MQAGCSKGSVVQLPPAAVATSLPSSAWQAHSQQSYFDSQLILSQFLSCCFHPGMAMPDAEEGPHVHLALLQHNANSSPRILPVCSPLIVMSSFIRLSVTNSFSSANSKIWACGVQDMSN